MTSLTIHHLNINYAHAEDLRKTNDVEQYTTHLISISSATRGTCIEYRNIDIPPEFNFTNATIPSTV